jgi:hypothetical protein
MHRVHHSVTIRETNSNFGFNLSWWDRIFGTYRDQPAAGHKDMTIGLSQYRDQSKLNIHNLIILPFIADTGYYSMNKWGKDPTKFMEKKMEEKKVKDSFLQIVMQMTQQDANLAGNVHGGVIMKQIDNTAGIVASRHSSSMVVTASLDRLDFS